MQTKKDAKEIVRVQCSCEEKTRSRAGKTPQGLNIQKIEKNGPIQLEKNDLNYNRFKFSINKINGG